MHPSPSTNRAVVALLGGLSLCLVSACGPGTGTTDGAPGGEPDPDLDALPALDGDGATDFVSASAGGAGGNYRYRGVDDALAGDASGDGDSGGDGDGDGDGGGAERAISEADIIQLHGEQLFALSEYAGLTIVDISEPSELRVLGRHRSAARPFEMYLQDGIAYVMLNGFYSFVYDEAAGVSDWRSTARLQALDVSDPDDIRVLGDLEVAGDISDSRLVGDILYLTTYQSGYCYHCDAMPSTRVAAFDVGDPREFRKVDELSFADDGGWGARSISVTTERMYVAGPNWEWSDDEPHSTIQVVDISDADGSLALGAEIEVAGQIRSRWQMEEHDGVLRVLSQRGGWRTPSPPVLETFAVTSADAVSPLGRLALTLPRPEDLQAVRFDGDRAYAITFEQVDPLFVIDLSDPAEPVQRGELEIPGWVYHMEPRGDRVYGLGFDQGNEDGGMHVSIFDVSDMDAPTMLSRVNFGGDWVDAAEDQDRIHKAFNLMLDAGLILVPFSGGEYDEARCSYSYRSGIQIIDVDGDALQKRGVAPQIGRARRSLMHDGTLFGVSDDAVQAFDITDRDAPEAIGSREVARNIQSLHVVGDRILRFGQDWWTDRATIDFTDPQDADSIEPTGELDLSNVLSDEQDACAREAYFGGQVLVHGDVAYVPRYRWEYDGRSSHELVQVLVVDLSGAAPRLVHDFVFELEADDGYFTNVRVTDSTLLIGHMRSDYVDTDGDGDEDYVSHSYYEIFDLTDPRAPVHTKRFEVPSEVAYRGWGYGPIGCGLDMGWGWWYGGDQGGALVRGDLIVSQHAEPVDDEGTRVRYFMDRLDVSDPRAPRMLPRVNIPGQIVDYRPERGLIVTLEDVLRSESERDYEDCHWRGSQVTFEWPNDAVRGEGRGLCRIYDRYVNTLALSGTTARRISRANLDVDMNSTSVAVSRDRVFAVMNERTRIDWDEPVQIEPRVDVLGIGSDGRLRQLQSVTLDEQPAGYGYPQIVARGDYGFITVDNRMLAIDTSDVTEPALQRHDMPGYYCRSLEVDQVRAYCAMGKAGVLSFEL